MAEAIRVINIDYNFDRRFEIDRRQGSKAPYKEERRLLEDRRSGEDRRNGLERRNGADRRKSRISNCGPDRRSGADRRTGCERRDFMTL